MSLRTIISSRCGVVGDGRARKGRRRRKGGIVREEEERKEREEKGRGGREGKRKRGRDVGLSRRKDFITFRCRVSQAEW